MSLSKNWITEPHIDFEYKKYILLAYLNQVSDNFTENKLYPHLAELIEHYRSLKSLHENKSGLLQNMPQRMTGMSLEEFKIVYEKIAEDNGVMQEIENIIEYSIPQMETSLREGKKIYDFIEERMNVFPIGIVPLNNEVGYVMLRNVNDSETKIYEYQISIFENPIEKYRGIHFNYVHTYEKTIGNTYEAIKLELIAFHKKLPNPATFVIEAAFAIPFEETFLPMAKRSLVKRIAGVA